MEECYKPAETFILVGGGIILCTSALVVILDVVAYGMKDNGCKGNCCGIFLT